jgi:hypothetical protein
LPWILQFGILHKTRGNEHFKGDLTMNTDPCLIGGCTEPVYAPAGTQTVCKEHFLHFLTWRKKKGGPGMFKKYSARPMDERDPTVEEWAQTIVQTATT